MKNKLFYLFGAAFLLCSISTFTACSDDNDEPIVEVPGDDDGKGDDGKDDDGKDDVINLNGSYDDKTLKMTYNGEELTGKRVTFTADEKLEKATILLSGVEKDLTDMLGGLIGELKFTTNSPIPGEKEIKLEDVTLTANADGTYSFEGKDENSNRTMLYKGTVKKDEMSIEITNTLANQELAGTWNLGPLRYSMLEEMSAPTSSPLWINWDTENNINAGVIEGIPFDMNPNSLFSWIFYIGDDAFLQMMGISGVDVRIQQWIKNLLQSVTVQPNGCMFATYSYSGDLNNPAWSSEMGHNIIRYYHGEEPNQVYIEANADFILSAIGGLLTRTRADNEQDLAVILKPLIDALKPAIEKGFPCTYEITGDIMRINLDGKFTQSVLIELVNVINTPMIYDMVMGLIDGDPSLQTYKPNIVTALQTLPNALKYKDSSLTTPCEYVKVGFELVKTAE